MSQILTLESPVSVFKSQLWCKVATIKPIHFQPLLVFLSFLRTSQNGRNSEPMWQLAPNEGPARGTATAWLFVALTELLISTECFNISWLPWPIVRQRFFVNLAQLFFTGQKFHLESTAQLFSSSILGPYSRLKLVNIQLKMAFRIAVARLQGTAHKCTRGYK